MSLVAELCGQPVMYAARLNDVLATTATEPSTTLSLPVLIDLLLDSPKYA